MRRFTRQPARFPAGTKYVLEARGPFVRRYLKFPDGRRLELAPSKALTRRCEALCALGLATAAGGIPRKTPARVAA
jgi:hypothetical protein